MSKENVGRKGVISNADNLKPEETRLGRAGIGSFGIYPDGDFQSLKLKIKDSKVIKSKF